VLCGRSALVFDAVEERFLQEIACQICVLDGGRDGPSVHSVPPQHHRECLVSVECLKVEKRHHLFKGCHGGQPAGGPIFAVGEMH